MFMDGRLSSTGWQALCQVQYGHSHGACVVGTIHSLSFLKCPNGLHKTLRIRRCPENAQSWTHDVALMSLHCPFIVPSLFFHCSLIVPSLSLHCLFIVFSLSLIFILNKHVQCAYQGESPNTRLSGQAEIGCTLSTVHPVECLVVSMKLSKDDAFSEFSLGEVFVVSCAAELIETLAENKKCLVEHSYTFRQHTKSP